MGEWFKRHWTGLVGATLVIWEAASPVWRAARLLFESVGDLALVVEHRTVLTAITAFLVSPPPYLTFIVILSGLALIYWDVTRRRQSAFPTGYPSEQDGSITPWQKRFLAVGVLIVAAIGMAGLYFSGAAPSADTSRPDPTLAALTDQVSAVEKRLDTSQQELAGVVAQNTALQNQLGSITKERDEGKQGLASISDQMTKLTAQLKATQQELTSARANSDAAHKDTPKIGALAFIPTHLRLQFNALGANPVEIEVKMFTGRRTSSPREWGRIVLYSDQARRP